MSMIGTPCRPTCRRFSDRCSLPLSTMMFHRRRATTVAAAARPGRPRQRLDGGRNDNGRFPGRVLDIRPGNRPFSGRLRQSSAA
ncbi:hypothetical protein RHCRD62_10533 [Rhodococcus sp. RD6.2]|nr:hypothetical protein RHCRD62_10533 [Rhodococcus sp. RD6.2]